MKKFVSVKTLKQHLVGLEVFLFYIYQICNLNIIIIFFSANEICKSKGRSKIMVHDVLEALNKTGFTEYNKDMEELVEQIIKNNNEKNKAGKKRNIKKNEIDIKEDKDIKEDEMITTKEKID